MKVIQANKQKHQKENEEDELLCFIVENADNERKMKAVKRLEVDANLENKQAEEPEI